VGCFLFCFFGGSLQIDFFQRKAAAIKSVFAEAIQSKSKLIKTFSRQISHFHEEKNAN
jgi:hypothetical protein